MRRFHRFEYFHQESQAAQLPFFILRILHQIANLSFPTFSPPTIQGPEYHPPLPKISSPHPVPSSQDDVETDQHLATPTADMPHQSGTGHLLGGAGNSP